MVLFIIKDEKSAQISFGHQPGEYREYTIRFILSRVVESPLKAFKILAGGEGARIMLFYNTRLFQPWQCSYYSGMD